MAQIYEMKGGRGESPEPVCRSVFRGGLLFEGIMLFEGWKDLDTRPSTFTWLPIDLEAPRERGTARLYYRVGWTAVILWDSRCYFADQILTFDGMIELIRSQLNGPLVNRVYED